MAEASADPLIGTTIGDFQIVSVLGQGAFGTVYRAVQLALDREVALKVLDPELARRPELAGRFAQEGAAAARLDHPSIVPVYRAGNEDGTLYIAMRLIRGPSLAAILDERGRLADADAVVVMQAMGDALDHAHRAGLVHRDVKPGNILVEGTLPRATVWLVDLGIAKVLDADDQITAEGMGTAWYMAPEQADPGPIDGRADLYSLGCVAYECIAGRPPFEGETVVAVLVGHRTGAVPSIGDATMDAFFAIALAKDPADRFQTGGVFADAFRRAVIDREAPSVSVPADGGGSVRPTAPTERQRRSVEKDGPADQPLGGRVEGTGGGRVGGTGRERGVDRAGSRARLAIGVALFAGILVIAMLAVAVSRRDQAATGAGSAKAVSSSVAGSITVAGTASSSSLPGTTSTSLVEISVAARSNGPARLRDPVGVSYDLPAGWEIENVTASNGFNVNLADQGGTTAQISSQKAAPAVVDDLVRANRCSGPATDATIGGLPAKRCELSPSIGSPQSLAYDRWLALKDGHSFFISIEKGVPPDQAQAFLDSVTFP